MLAESMDAWHRLGSFTIQEFWKRAESEYKQAAERSSVPTIVASLLKARTQLGELPDNLVEDPLFTAETMSNVEVLHALAEASAFSHKYDDALHYEQTALSTSPPPMQPIVAYDRGEVTSIPGTLFVQVTYPYSNYGAGQSSVQDFGFVPQSRLALPNDIGADYYMGTAEERYLYLAHQSGNNTQTQEMELATLCQSDRSSFLCQAISIDFLDSPRGYQLDYLQDLWRYYGNLDAATELVNQWIQKFSNEALALERLGEIRFLQNRWDESAQASQQAVNLYKKQTYPGIGTILGGSNSPLAQLTGPGWAQLRAATAERMAGNTTDSRDLYQKAISLQSAFDFAGMNPSLGQDSYRSDFETYLILEEGQAAYEQHDYNSAIDFMTQSIEVREKTGNVGGAQEQVISASYFAMNQPQEALDWAEKALAYDPYSPLYQEAVADAKRALGTQTPSSTPSGTSTSAITPDESRTEMIVDYQSALDLNSSLFSSWNNMGVLLAQDGQTDAAIDAFKNALAAREDYATAWFNLGTIEASQPGFTAFVLSEGALGKAGLINPDLKDMDPVLTFDDEVYSSSIDVSKPIPADWHLSQSIRSTPTTLTAALIAMIALRVGWAVGKDWFSGRWAEGALRNWSNRPGLVARFTRWRPRPFLTTVVTLAALVFLGGSAGWVESILCASVVVALLLLHAMVPRLPAKNWPVRHVSFPPASLVTILLTPFGLGFAPPAPLATSMPVANDSTPYLIRRIGLIAIGAATLLYAAGAWITAVPTARTATTMGLVLVSSALVPVNPLDGARLGLNRWIDLLVTLCLIAATVLFALQIL